MRRTGWAMVAALGGLLGVAVVSGTALAADTSVSISGFAFSPGSVTITEGDSVTWTNQDATAHTATGDGFDTESLDQGQTATITFDTAGTYAYACAIHPQMTGTVVVQAAAGDATPPPTDMLTTDPAEHERPDVIGSVALLLAGFGVSMLAATFLGSRRASR